MGVGKRNIACVLMNTKNKWLPRFGEIPRHLFNPLPRLKFAERIDPVRRGMIL